MMRKLFTILTAMSVFISLISCSTKKDADNSKQSVDSPVVTQLKYKVRNLSFPEDFSNRLYLDNYKGVRLIYRNYDNQTLIMEYDEDMNPTSKITLFDDSDQFYSTFATTKSDGTIVFLLMSVEYYEDVITDYEDYFKNAKVSFMMRTYSPSGEMLSETDIQGIEPYFSFKDTMINQISEFGENFVIQSVQGNFLMNNQGEILEFAESDNHMIFGTDTEGKAIAANWNGWSYVPDNKLKIDTEKFTRYEKWLNCSGPIFKGNEQYKFFMVMNEGIYGMTNADEFIKIMDFSDSNSTSQGMEHCCYAGEGKFVSFGTDQLTTTGLFFHHMTVRPDDYVENKELVKLGVNANDNNGKDLALFFNKQSDDYNVEIKKYTTDDDLKYDVLAGDPPDIYAFRDSSTMYNYANLGAFADLNKLMESHDDMKREDFTENILTAYDYKGALYALPIAYQVEAVLANSDVIPRKMRNWSYSEFLDIMENLPEGMDPCPGNYFYCERELIFSELLNKGIGSWINYNDYTCNFVNDDFIRLLEYCNNVSLIPSTVEGNEGSDKQLANKTAAYQPYLHMANYRMLFMEILHSDLLLNDNYSILNYPSNEGRGEISCLNSTNLAILNNSKCPEGAWAFMNYALSKELYDTYNILSLFISPKKDIYESEQKRFINECKDPSSSFNEINVDNNSKKIIDKDYLKYVDDFINDSNKLFDRDEKIDQIVKEESLRYINGEVTSHECAEFIQNRVTIYLNERK